jgi:hypothetical protein
MNLIFDDNGMIDRTRTMYPSELNKVTDNLYFAPVCSTTYGYVIKGSAKLPNGKVAEAGEYFCYTESELECMVDGTAVFFSRIGFRGQPMVGGPLEERGRLMYIDTCSDSLLIYPPRMGDPSISALFFPPDVQQSYHTHPSLRFGVVVAGTGYAALEPTKYGEDGMRIPLEVGTAFCINEGEVHRFVTEDKSMTVIAYHPDGDWGPTDHNHTMLNRTYKIGKF